ncbi:uncharacterized protein LOC134245360 [Saccostrea cucullata]|uniref:uncharacterized protein LOC134245360 n=1 Tax=Saccostrea cuccullata TaxID=36930 RepID=UPI002ED3669B
MTAEHIINDRWISRPPQLREPIEDNLNTEHHFCDPENDAEIRKTKKVETLKTTIDDKSDQLEAFHITHRLERFSTWKVLVRSIDRLKALSRRYHSPKDLTVSNDSLSSEDLIIRMVQQEVFAQEIMCLQSQRPLPRSSSLTSFNPVIDQNGLLRVGAGALQSAGFWIIGEKRLISSLLHKCVKYRRLRGKYQSQLMSDLPADQIQPCPSFTYIGLDTFGPWTIATRRTRGGVSNSKRWSVLFTCLYKRAIHIEVIEELSSSSFINCLRRFISLRGNVKEIRSDRGSNFVGAIDDLDVKVINVEDKPVREFLLDQKVTWIFNPPHSSHMGGVWERMIGIARRILDSMLMDLHSKHLTHEVLTTHMAEVCAIVNSRPTVPVSSDPEAPMILSPNMLLTQKTYNIPTNFIPFSIKDMYKSQWHCFQHLANIFWDIAGKRNTYRHSKLGVNGKISYLISVLETLFL